MTPESKVVSLDTAKKLKELGFPQETERWWHVPNMNGIKNIEGNQVATRAVLADDMDVFKGALKVAAPDAQEIGELLPRTIEPSNDLHGYELKIVRPSKSQWAVGYHDDENGIFDVWNHESLSEAAAYCWIYLKENNLL